MPKPVFALANAARHALIACANEFHVSADKPLHIKYGDYPYGRHKAEDGKTYFVTQRFDRPAAEAWRAALANELSRGGKGYPIYAGHPDVPELAHKYPDKRAWAWGNRLEIGEAGADLFALWNEDIKNGFAYFSPFWVGPVISQNGMSVVTQMTGCKSIGLTNDPNIREFRLPNESAAPTEENAMNELIAFLKLDPAATPDDVLAAVKKLSEDNAGLKAAADAAKAEAAQAQSGTLAAETALANERAAHIDVLLTQAVGDGRVTPAGKPSWGKNLKADFARFSHALANEKPQIKTAGVVDATRRSDPSGGAQGKILALVNEAKVKGMTHDEAWRHVKANNQELFALQA